MAIEVPEGWATLLKTLTGMPFPQANEDSLRLVSDDYRLMAEKFQEVEELLRQVVSRVDEDFEGQTATEFVAYARQFVEMTNGNQSILDRAHEDAMKLSKNAHKTAADIEYTKWMIFGQLALLVVQIALAQALMPLTAGLSEIWAAAAIGAFRAMALLILKFLVAQIVMQTITGLVGGLLLDSILQLTQMGRGDRTEWNTDFTKDAAKFAAIGGVLGGPFALLGGAFGKLLGNLGGKGLGKILGNDAGNVLAKGLAGGGKGAGGAGAGLGKGAGAAGAGAGKGAGAAGAGAGKGAGAAGAGAGKGAGAAGAGAGKGAGAAGTGAGKGAGAAGTGAGKGAGAAGTGAGKGAGGLGEGVGKGVSGVGDGVGKGVSGAGDGVAGAGGRSGVGAAGNTISEKSARELGESLGNIMGRTNESLNQLGADGIRGSAAGAVGREVVKDFANAFEKHLGGALGNETAKNLGREYGESLVKNWAGKADWQGLTRSLDDALKPFAKDLGEAGVRALSHDLPGSFVRTVGGNMGFHIGNFVGEMAGDTAHAVVTEGMYNLIFGPDHQFTVSGWTAAAGAAGSIMGRGVAHGLQSVHNLVQGPAATPPPRPPAFSSDAPAPSAPTPRPSTESGPTVRDGSASPKNDADNRTLTDSGSDTDSLYYLDVDDLSDSGTLYGDGDANDGTAPIDVPTATAPSFATSSNGADFTHQGDVTSTPHGNDTPNGNQTSNGNDTPHGNDAPRDGANPNGDDAPHGSGRPDTTNGSGGDADTTPGIDGQDSPGPAGPEPSAPPNTVSELDLLLNSLLDVPDAPPSPHPAPVPDADLLPEDGGQGLTDLDSVLADLPDVPDTTPGAVPSTDPDQLLAGLPDVPDTPLGPVLTPEEQRLLADLPHVPRHNPAQPSGDGSGMPSSSSSSGRNGGSDGSDAGNRPPNDPDQLLQERLDRLRNQQEADPDATEDDLAARMEKLREDGPDGFGRPARVDDLRERYRAALEEEGTDGPDHDGTVTGPESDGSGLPHGAPGQIAAPSAPGGSAGSSRSVTAQPNAGDVQRSSRPPGTKSAASGSAAHEAMTPDALDTLFPDVPQDLPGSRPPTTDGTDGTDATDRMDATDLDLPDVPQHEPGARPETERTGSDVPGPVADDSPGRPRTESADELPFPEGFDGDLDALLALLDDTAAPAHDTVSLLAELPDAPQTLNSAEQRRLAADVTRETDALLADARRVGVDRETRNRLGERVHDDIRAGRHAEAAESLRELSDLVALHGLGERLQQFRRHMDGGYEGRAAQLGMRRTEWLRHGLAVEEAALGGDPRRTTRLLDDFEQRLGTLGSELKDRADASPEALEQRLADSRRADAEAAGMERERFRAWEERLEQAATPDEYQRVRADYAAELETTRRLTTLRELGASEAELASWKARFDDPAQSGDAEAPYARRIATLSGEADLAALQGRLDALREGGPQQEPAQPPPPQDGQGDGSPPPTRPDDLLLDSAHDLPELEARLDRLSGGGDRAGMSPEERQQWADRHAQAGNDAARQTIEHEHADRLAQLERRRRLDILVDGGPEGARRTPESQDAWRSRIDEAGDDPQALDRVLDDYDTETERLRREGKERLEQELRTPDRLRDLDRRIDRSLDRLPEEVRTRAARDARSLVERLRDLTAVTEETPAPAADDDATTEQHADAPATDLPRPVPVPEPTQTQGPIPVPTPAQNPAPVPGQRPDPAPTSVPVTPDSAASPAPSPTQTPAPSRAASPAPSSSSAFSRTNSDEGGGGSGRPRTPTGSEGSRRGSVSSDDQVMEAPRQRNDATGSEDRDDLSVRDDLSAHTRDRDDLSTHTRDHDELSSRGSRRESRRVRTESEDDALTSPASERDSELPHRSDDDESVASVHEESGGDERAESQGQESTKPEDTSAQENTKPEDTRAQEDTEPQDGPAKENGESEGGDEPQDAPSGGGHRPQDASEERQPRPSARDTALDALSADEFEQRMYRARRDRPDLTTDEALRDEVYRRINEPCEPVEQELSLADPLLTEGVDPLPSGRPDTFVTFDDNAMVPTSMQGQGHGHITLRGVDRLLTSLARRWSLHPDGVAALNLVLTQSPHTLLAPRTFVLPTADGGTRQVTLSLDSYGNWRRFAEPTPLAVSGNTTLPAPSTGGSVTSPATAAGTDAPRAGGSATSTAPKTDVPKADTAKSDTGRTDTPEADASKTAETETTATTDAPVKVETELRARPGATETKTLGTSRAFGLAVPISATGTPFGALGSVSLSARRMEASYTYTQENRAQTSVTAVGKDGSHLHVSDLHLVAESAHAWNAKGKEVPANQQRQQGAADRQHYRVRDGVAWRVPDSVTDPALPDRLPTSFAFAPGARPHLLAPLNVTTGTRLLDWALRAFPEAAPGTFLRRQLADLFGGENLRTAIAQSSGETVVTAPLFADLNNRSLGSVEMRLVPVDATLISASDKTEVKRADAQRSTGTTEKKNTQGWGGALTAGLQVTPLADPKLLNFQVAAAAGLTTQRAESSYSGNTAESVRTLNSRGHSGLYNVRFKLEVRRQGGAWESPAPVRQAPAPAQQAPAPAQQRDEAQGAGPAEGDTLLDVTVQLPRADARRLAGWDDGTTPLPPAEAPPAPAYLSASDPATFGLHAVVDLAPAGTTQTAASHTSLADALIDRVQEGLHRAYPDLVLPPGRHTAHTGGSDRAYNNAVRNTHLLRQALARTVLEGSLDRLISTGMRIQLERLGTFTKRYVVVTVRAQATDRQFLGTHHDLGVANNLLSTRRADSATTRTHGWTAGVDVGLTGIDRFGGTGSVGYRYGRQTAYGMTYGPTLTPDGGITSSGPQHLWSYHLDFSAEATGFTRPRQLFRTLTGELLATGWFVRPDADTVDLLRTAPTNPTGQDAPAGTATAPPPVAGRVTIAVPASLSVPSALPVERPTTAPTVTDMTPAMAELLSSGKPVPSGDWTAHPLFDGLHSVQNVTSPELVQRHLRELLASVSGNSWVYGTDGTPASGALAEAFAVGRNEADFSDAAQTGKHVSDLFGRTPVTDITASVSAWPQLRGPRVIAVVDSGDLALSAIGSGTAGAGHSVAKVSSHTVNLLGAFRAKHTDTFQTAGTYGATWTPFQRTRTATEAATFSANPAHTVQYTGPMALVSADVAWHLAARSQPSGLLQGPVELVSGSKPAGRIVEVPDGVLVWVPLEEARKAGLFDDGLTAPPSQQLFTTTGAAAHGTITVGRIDMAPAVTTFTEHLLKTLPQHRSWLGPKSLLADQLGGLARQMTTMSPSGMRALQTGMENGGTSLRLARNKIGPSRDAGLTVTLRRTGFTPGPLRHDVKPTVARPTSTADTVTEKLARGHEAGVRVTEAPGVQNESLVRNGAVTLDDKAGSTRSGALAHAVTDAVSAQVAFEGPVVTGTTTFEATFTLELPDGSVVTRTYDVGDAEVVMPLSLARPQATPATTGPGSTTGPATTTGPGSTTGPATTTGPVSPAGAKTTTGAKTAGAKTAGAKTATTAAPATAAARRAPRPMMLPPERTPNVALRERGAAGKKLFAAGPESVVVTTVGGITTLRDAAAYALDAAVKGRGTKTDGPTPMPTDAHGRYLRKSLLTRPGTAAGEALKGGISTDVLSAYLPQIVRDSMTVVLHDTTSAVGGTDAVLTISANVDLSQAKLLAVDAQAGLGGSRRTSENDTYTGDTTDSHAPAMTVGPGYQSTPLVQSNAALPGWTDSDAAGSAADRRTSALTTLKPFAGGAVLVQAPLHVVQTAKASHRIADMPLVPAPLRPGNRPPVTVEHTVADGVTMWVSFDVAREHGLLPPEVEAAATVVKEQTEKYVKAAKEAGTTEQRLRSLAGEITALRARLGELLAPPPPTSDLLTAPPSTGDRLPATRGELAAVRTRYAEVQQDLANQRRDLATAQRNLAGASEAAWKAVEHYTLTGPKSVDAAPVPWTEPEAAVSTTADTETSTTDTATGKGKGRAAETDTTAGRAEPPATVPGYPPLSELLAAASHEGSSTEPAAGAGRDDVMDHTAFWLNETAPLPDAQPVRLEHAKAAAWAEYLRATDAGYRTSLEAARTARQELDAALLRAARSGKAAARDVAPVRAEAIEAAVRTTRAAYKKAVERLTARYRELGFVRANFDAVDAAVRPLLAPLPAGRAPLAVTPWHPVAEPDGYVRPTDTSAPDPYTSQGKDAEGRPLTLTDPDGRVLQLQDPPSTGPAHLDRGTSFHRSLLDAVERAHPKVLAELGLHPHGREISAADVQHLRQRLADRLTADRDEIAPFLAIDPQERFTAQELTDAGIVLTQLEATEYAASRHRLPQTVADRLTPDQRLELARRTLLRPGGQLTGDRKDAGWNHSAGDLAALLAARVLGVPVTVVHADLHHVTFSPLDAGGRSGVVLHLADDLYRPAVPRPQDSLLLNTDSEITELPDTAASTEPSTVAPVRTVDTGGPIYYIGHGTGPVTAVPRELNFIWLGGELTTAARDNIQAWAARAKAAGWTVTLWTDSAAGRKNEGFLQSSAEAGDTRHGKVKNLFVKDPALILQKNPFSKAQTLYNEALDLKSYAMASDIARYALLHKHGGVYLDVDLGPGAVNLRPEGVMMPKGPDTLPMFGPLLQDMKSVRRRLELPDDAVPTEEQIQQAADMAFAAGDFGNHFIIAHPGSPFMRQVLRNLPDFHAKDAGLKGMLVAAMKRKEVAGWTGPRYLVQQFKEHVAAFPSEAASTGQADAPAAEGDGAVVERKFTPAPLNRYRVRTEDWADWTRLEWLTTESENQEVPTTATPAERQGTLVKRLGGTIKKFASVRRWGGGRSGSDQDPTLQNEGTLLTGFDPATDLLDQDGGASEDVLVGKDGRTVSFERMRQSLRTIKDFEGNTIGYASHSDKDWAPRKDFYANYRADQQKYAVYRPEGKGAFAPVAEHPTAPRTVPWHAGALASTDHDNGTSTSTSTSTSTESGIGTAKATGADAPDGQTQAPQPIFFDAHGSEHGVKLHVDGELPLVVDGAQFARFMETLTDPDQPPAPVVLVACNTAATRSTDGGSVVADAARAVPGRRWYAPDVAVGHVTGSGTGEATGVLALLQDPATGRPGQWVTASEPDALDVLLRQEGEEGTTLADGGTKPSEDSTRARRSGSLLLNTPAEDGADAALREASEPSGTAHENAVLKAKEQFARQSQELWDRINQIKPLARNDAFKRGIADWLTTVESDVDTSLAGRPAKSEFNKSAVDAIMKGFQSAEVMGHQVNYMWFSRQQDTAGFEGILGARAAASAQHGQIWSKMGAAEAISTANVGTGVALESSVQGYIFDGLGFGLPRWDASPTMAELWHRLSRTYAQNLTNRVTAHVLDGIHDSSVLTTTEWPEARKRIESGEIGGLDVVLYTAVPGGQRHELRYVETVTVRTQEEFDRLPRVPDTDEWRERQRKIDLEQKDVLKEIYQRELQVHLFSRFANKALGAQGGEDVSRFRPTRTRNNSVTDDGALPGDGSDVLRDADLMLNTEPASASSAEPLRLAMGGHQGETTSIPKRLNFIWLGGDMKPEARANLRNWAEKAQNAAWDMSVWTDEKGRTANADFLAELAEYGVSSPSVDTAFGQKRLLGNTAKSLSRAESLYETGQKLRSFALASDAARYAILYKQGGVYLDVDVAPGNFVLPAEGVRMPSGDTLPMFGPRLRDASSVLGTSPPPGAQLTLEAIRAKAVEMYDRGELGNQLIAAHQKNPFLRYLLTELVKLDSLSDLERDVKLSEIRQRNVAHITGPNFIDGRLNEYNRAWVKKNDTASYGETRGSARFRPTEATRDLWSELAWVTLESENQETASIHSVQGTEQPPQDTLRRSGTVREKLKRFGGSLTGTFRSSHQDGGNDAGPSSGTRKFFSNSGSDSSAGEGPFPHSPASLLASPPAGATPDAVLTGKDGRQVSYGQVYEGLTVIRGADGRTLGYASHSAQDWAPRRDFYAAYRPDEALFAHYRATEDGDFVLDTDTTTDSAAGEVPWHSGAAARDAQEPVTPLFFDAHGTEDGVELHLAGGEPLVIDGAQFAHFLETLRDPARPPAPVVLVACETAKVRGDGGSVATDAAGAVPGRLWYAPDTYIGHARPADGSEGAAGVLGLLADPAARRRGAWVVAGEQPQKTAGGQREEVLGSRETAAAAPAPHETSAPQAVSLSDLIVTTLNASPRTATGPAPAETGEPATAGQTVPEPNAPEHTEQTDQTPQTTQTTQTEAAPAAAGTATPPTAVRPLDITYTQDTGGGAVQRQLDAADPDLVRAYVFDTLLKKGYDAVELLLRRLRAMEPAPGYLGQLEADAAEFREATAVPAPLVPKELHFVWLGGDLPRDALQNITRWAGAAQAGGWTVNLWTDSRTSLGMSTRFTIRTTPGLFRQELAPVIDPRLAAVFADASEARAYPLASDLARYSVLQARGGMYADVDLGPGSFVFSDANTPRLRPNDPPVLGPLIRDRSGLNTVLRDIASESGTPRPPTTGPLRAEDVRRAAAHLLETGAYGNHFIIAPPSSSFMERMIAQSVARLDGVTGGEELRSAAAAATGPFPLMHVLAEHLRAEFGVNVLERGEYPLFQRQGAAFHDGIDWLTPESENQAYEN
ncbi:glycosyltransferase [Streptomyces californicus]|uniref:glycosyltransferase n=1 Tax=Streptomyces californicus TaxID=67351 RepID=UPI00296F2778|nr:glycosyltransferase [Streptomyces californicus]MDW4899709.1 glycosyltransferase [Streptomyces californicus]